MMTDAGLAHHRMNVRDSACSSEAFPVLNSHVVTFQVRVRASAWVMAIFPSPGSGYGRSFTL